MLEVQLGTEIMGALHGAGMWDCKANNPFFSFFYRGRICTITIKTLGPYRTQQFIVLSVEQPSSCCGEVRPMATREIQMFDPDTRDAFLLLLKEMTDDEPSS